MVTPTTQEHNFEDPQVLNLGNICIVTSTASFSGCGWVWKDIQLGEGSTYGDTKLQTVRDCFAFRSGGLTMGDGEHAAEFDMPEFQDGFQGFDCDD